MLRARDTTDTAIAAKVVGVSLRQFRYLQAAGRISPMPGSRPQRWVLADLRALGEELRVEAATRRLQSQSR